MTPAKNVFLVFPPQCWSSLAGPHLALPQLKAFLKGRGFDVTTIDLNLAFFRAVRSPAIMTEYLDSLTRVRDELNHAARITSDEFDRLVSLLQIDSLKERLPLLKPGAALGPEDLSLSSQALQLVMARMPQDFDGAVSAVSERRDTPITSYYDRLDLQSLFGDAGVVGLSIAFHLQLYPALELAYRVHGQYGAGVPVILGGSQVSLLADEQKYALANLPYVSAVIVSEGEVPLLHICEQLKSRGSIDWSGIPNTFCRVEQEVRAPSWHLPPPIADLPPPEFDHESLQLYLANELTLPVYVSKGCYWGKCKFCDYTKLYTPGQSKGPAWATFRPVETLVRDMASLQRLHGVDRFYLVSDAIPPKYYKELANAIISSGLRVRLNSYCRVEKTHDFAFFELLGRAGVESLTFGVEATEDRILKLIDKGNTVLDVRKSIRFAHAAGVKVFFNLIPDYPTITWDEIQNTVRFIRENVDYIWRLNPQFFALSTNSQIANEQEEHGLVVDTDRLVGTNHGVHSLPFVRNRGLSPEQLSQVHELFPRLAADMVLYQRTRHLVRLASADGFDWRRAEFMLTKEFQLCELNFDPLSPTRENGQTHFERLRDPQVFLYSPTTGRWVRHTPTIARIIHVGAAKGVFSIGDVATGIPEGDNVVEGYLEDETIQSVMDLLADGFIERVFHPWLGGFDSSDELASTGSLPMTTAVESRPL